MSKSSVLVLCTYSLPIKALQHSYSMATLSIFNLWQCSDTKRNLLSTSQVVSCGVRPGMSQPPQPAKAKWLIFSSQAIPNPWTGRENTIGGFRNAQVTAAKPQVMWNTMASVLLF